MMGYLRPQLLRLNDDDVVIRIKLARRSKNHLDSMYFGALAVGADIAGGLHGLYHANQAGIKVSLAFKSFQAQFIKRPELDVYFVSHMGRKIADMIVQTQSTQQRVNELIDVEAYTHYEEARELVATFKLELSLKALKA